MASEKGRRISRLLLVGVLLVILAGCGGNSKRLAEKQIPTATRGSLPRSTTGPSGGPVSPGFEPDAFSAVSERSYWLLGSIPCRTGRCTAIVRTTDGGRSFVSIPAPPLSTEGVIPTLQFASRRDGFAFAPSFVPRVTGGIYTTHDGGASWHRLALRDVLAFAASGGTAYAVTARCSPQRCIGYRFERSPVSTDAWRAAALPFALGGSGLNLAAHGKNVWVLDTPAGSEPRPSELLARSSDGGRTFLTRSGPCYPDLGGELSATSASVIWVVCPTGMLAGASRSTNGGITFKALTNPGLVNSARLAPASKNTAVVAPNGAGFRFLRTTDGGRTWRAVSMPRRPLFIFWIGFIDDRVGAALVQTGWDTAAKTEIQTLWQTRDGGAHWSTVRIR